MPRPAWDVDAASNVRLSPCQEKEIGRKKWVIRNLVRFPFPLFTPLLLHLHVSEGFSNYWASTPNRFSIRHQGESRRASEEKIEWKDPENSVSLNVCFKWAVLQGRVTLEERDFSCMHISVSVRELDFIYLCACCWLDAHRRAATVFTQRNPPHMHCAPSTMAVWHQLRQDLVWISIFQGADLYTIFFVWVIASCPHRWSVIRLDSGL